MNLFIKVLLGAAMLLIGLLARTRNHYIAGLLPRFPTFALLANYIVGSERGSAELKATSCSACGRWCRTWPTWRRGTG